MQIMNNTLFFIHIPKTAGTSLRKGAEQFFGTERIYYDYSLNSKETSESVSLLAYREPDLFHLYKKLRENNIKMVGGHVNASKYITLAGIINSFTFIRDPIKRLTSDYLHFVRHYNFDGSFQDFYRRPHFINRQAKILHGIPIRALGFIGITEHYSDSLRQLNQYYGIEIPDLEINMAGTTDLYLEDIDEQQRDEILDLNKEDISLYRHSLALFADRKKLFEQSIPFTHGGIQQCSLKTISGWAWQKDFDNPIKVRVLCNGNVHGEQPASDFRPGLLHLSPPRKGYVGFHLQHQGKPGDIISCQVASTGQVLGEAHVPDK